MNKESAHLRHPPSDERCGHYHHSSSIQIFYYISLVALQYFSIFWRYRFERVWPVKEVKSSKISNPLCKTWIARRRRRRGLERPIRFVRKGGEIPWPNFTLAIVWHGARNKDFSSCLYRGSLSLCLLLLVSDAKASLKSNRSSRPLLWASLLPSTTEVLKSPFRHSKHTESARAKIVRENLRN